MILHELVGRYKQASIAFNNCPDAIRSGPVSEQSRQIIDEYFRLREELRKTALMINRIDSSGLYQKVAAYGVWAQAAEETARLNLLGASEEGAIIMEHLGRTEAAMLASV